MQVSTKYILFVFSGAFSQLNEKLREEKKAPGPGGRDALGAQGRAVLPQVLGVALLALC